MTPRKPTSLFAWYIGIAECAPTPVLHKKPPRRLPYLKPLRQEPAYRAALVASAAHMMQKMHPCLYAVPNAS